jgi:hypothetical protein
MWEVVKSEREGRAPLLEEVRRMLCEPEQTEEPIDGYWARTNETSGFDT